MNVYPNTRIPGYPVIYVSPVRFLSPYLLEVFLSETVTYFRRSFSGLLGGMVRDMAPGTSKSPGTRVLKDRGPNTGRVIGLTHTRPGSDRSGCYKALPRVVDERDTTTLPILTNVLGVLGDCVGHSKDSI